MEETTGPGADVPGRSESFDRLAELSVSIAAGSSPADQPKAVVKELVDNWLNICTSDTSHANCRLNLVNDLTLPMRLLDIFPNEQDVEVQLVDFDNQNQSPRPSFIALSHRWGAPPTVPTTTKANIDAMKKGISLGSLSKTYQDAIQVARNVRIRGWRVRYMWIDFLCIVQDDKNDWEQNVSVMHKVYAMATCVIAASVSSDTDAGFFDGTRSNHRGGQSLCMNCITKDCNGKARAVTNHQCSWSYDLANSDYGPLSSRGWCFQERELSRRIIHFTSGGLLWECRAAIASSNHPVMIPRNHWSEIYSIENAGLGRITQSHIRSIATNDWIDRVPQYSTRQFTYLKDKLPAIFGFASILAPFIRSEYLAGVWLVDFARAASWYPDLSARGQHLPASSWPTLLSNSLAPSWSWASTSCPVTFPPGIDRFDRGWAPDNNLDPLRKKYPLNNEIELSDIRGTFDVFGRSQDSVLHLVGACMKVRLSESNFLSDFRTLVHDGRNVRAPKIYRIFHRFNPFSRHTVSDGIIAFDLDPIRLPAGEFQILKLGKSTSRFWPCEVYSGLVLLPVPDEPLMLFRRVGVFEVGIGNKHFRKGVKILPISLV